MLSWMVYAALGVFLIAGRPAAADSGAFTDPIGIPATASSQTPTITLTMNKSVYVPGDTITASDFRIQNASTSSVKVALRVWLKVPVVGEVSLIDLGKDGTFSIPAGIDVSLAPLSLISVSDTFPPRGTWELNGRFTGPATGLVLHEDLNSFEVASAGTLVGEVGDPAKDATPTAVSPSPDLARGTIRVSEGSATLSVRCTPGTFAPKTTFVQFMLDTDQDHSTGHPGSDAGGINDKGIIGSEYLVNLGSGAYGSEAWIYRHDGNSNLFAFVGKVNVAFLVDGMDAVVPLSLIGNDDGQVNFKVVCAAYITDYGFTGILDYMPDVGLAAGVVK